MLLKAIESQLRRLKREKRVNGTVTDRPSLFKY